MIKYHHSGKDACLCAAGQCSALLCEKITVCRRENTVPSVWRNGYQEGDWCHTGCVFRDRCICWYILYFLLMIKLPANWIQGFWEKEGIFVDQKAVMVYLFLIFSFLPGSFLVSNLTEGAKDYVLLHVMRIPAVQYYRSKMVLKGVKDTICFLVPLLWFGFGAESALFVVSLFLHDTLGMPEFYNTIDIPRKKGKKYFGNL